MTNARKRFLGVLVLVALFVIQPTLAQDYDASGVWQSTTGNTFVIPASEDSFDIYIELADGSEMSGEGEWDEYGYSFSYTVDGMAGSAYVEYDSESDALRVTSPSGTTSWWQRTSY